MRYYRVYAGEEQIGYLYSTLDVVRARSYSSTPFDAIAGIDMAGNLTGARVIKFHDPYLQGFPQRVERLGDFIDAHLGYLVQATSPAPLTPDFVQGTTVSARTMRAGILDAGRIILQANDPRPPVTAPMLNRYDFALRNWDELRETGAVSDRIVTFGDVSAAFAAAGVTPVSMRVPLNKASPESRYTQLIVALVTPTIIGKNVLIPDAFAKVEAAPDDVAMIAMMSGGYYDFRGSQYQSAKFDHKFDRVWLVQDDLTLEFYENQFERVGASVGFSGGPILSEAGLFRIPLSIGFDPLAPFEIVLMVHATDAAGVEHSVEFPVSYNVPDEALLLPYVEPPPAWVEAWQASWVDIAILVAALGVLTLIFVFQARLSRSRQLHKWVRNGFLVFTLVWLGWIAGGQLSIVHIVNYIKGPFDGVDLGFYLAEPLIVIVSIYVVLSLILVGRGVFCGWLCPFGALQELTAKFGRLLRLPVWNPSEKLQRWLWLPKYGVAALIVVVAFAAPEMLASVEEVEPFKTAITSTFTRPWPYVTYALLLVGMSLFTERFFCRFLCPLGGVLALGDRLHLFTWLKRRPQCGGTGGCHLCEKSCPVKAIESSGKIIMSECFQCLDCQVEYYDDHRCPPLAQDRKRRQRAAKASAHQPLVLTRNGATPSATA